MAELFGTKAQVFFQMVNLPKQILAKIRIHAKKNGTKLRVIEMIRVGRLGNLEL